MCTLQGSVATSLRRGRIFDDSFIANVPRSVPVIEFEGASITVKRLRFLSSAQRYILPLCFCVQQKAMTRTFALNSDHAEC